MTDLLDQIYDAMQRVKAHQPPAEVFYYCGQAEYDLHKKHGFPVVSEMSMRVQQRIPTGGK